MSGTAAGVERTGGGASGRALWPGLLLVATGVVLCQAIAALWAPVSPLVAAVIFGVLLANVARLPSSTGPGLHFSGHQLLRAGVVLLGFRLAAGDIIDLGGPGVALVVVTVTITFLATRALGRLLGLSEGLSLLVATGFSICGASAVAAMQGVAEAEEEEAAYAVALVTLCGTLSIVGLPLVGASLGLSDTAFGTWAGASVHDVGQVVATASTAGSAALATALLVKLTRVALLAPVVAGVGLTRRRSVSQERRPPLVPRFVIGFLLACALRSTGVVGPGFIDAATTLSDLLLTGALVGLGSSVSIMRLRRIGGRPLLLGMLAWAVIAATSLGGTLLLER
ncbi:YeiH family protein [Iamia sp.]|uniref:YeiH family protein n=1 Tax=Iamia sp. TaxID=2722710 RepID=UPI002BEB4460|nr:putative sulfate exporter family transporter [Iamia sp.]HXH58611.1 putative sulfate exporter family transporter [Iamia sp.]